MKAFLRTLFFFSCLAHDFNVSYCPIGSSFYLRTLKVLDFLYAQHSKIFWDQFTETRSSHENKKALRPFYRKKYF